MDFIFYILKSIKKSCFILRIKKVHKHLPSKKGFFTKLKEVFTGKPIHDEMYEELEDLLIQSDLGFDMTLRIIEELVVL